MSDRIRTPYLDDLETMERYSARVLGPMKARAVEQIASVLADAQGAYTLEALLAPARQIVAYVDDVLSLVASARIGRADPKALADAAAAVRSLES